MVETCHKVRSQHCLMSKENKLPFERIRGMRISKPRMRRRSGGELGGGTFDGPRSPSMFTGIAEDSDTIQRLSNFHQECDNEHKAKADEDLRFIWWTIQSRIGQGRLFVLLNVRLSYRVLRTLRRHLGSRISPSLLHLLWPAT